MGVEAFSSGNKLKIRRIQTNIHGESDDSIGDGSYSPPINGFMNLRRPSRRSSRRVSKVHFQSGVGGFGGFNSNAARRVRTEEKAVGNGGIDGFLGLLHNYTTDSGKKAGSSLAKKLEGTPELSNLVKSILKELEHEEAELETKLFTVRSRISRIRTLLDKSGLTPRNASSPIKAAKNFSAFATSLDV